jgi:hypothetical protein
VIQIPDRSLLPVLCLSLALSACGSGGSSASYEEQDFASDERAEFDEDTARDQAVSDLSDQTFQDVGDTSRCTEDCSGHDAGWQWAQDNDVTDGSECSGSGSFEDGCQAYVEELESQVELAREDEEAGGEEE